MRKRNKLIRTILFLTVSLFIIGLVSVAPSSSIVYADSGSGDPMPKSPPDTTVSGTNETDDADTSIWDAILDLVGL